MEKRLEETQSAAESNVTAEITALKEKQKEIEERLKKANQAWNEDRAHVAARNVEESPVKLDLDACRAIKAKWFEVTPDARRGRLDAGKKGAINARFREWLQGEARRGEVCTKVLAQKLGPKTKPSSYDFTDLDFYVLLELYENELDKANISVERKAARDKEIARDAIEKELDAVVNKIQLAQQKGGPDYEEYLDIKGRIGTVRDIDKRIQDKYMGAREIMTQINTLREKQAAEEREASKALAAAQRKLAAIR